MYVDKLMCMVTNTHFEVSTDTMHQYVDGPTALKMMMRMLSNELDRGTISMYLDAMGASVDFSRMSPLSMQTPSQTTKLDISLSPSIITRMSKSWSCHNCLSLSDSLHGLLKPILSHMGACVDCNVTSCKSE